MAFFDSFVRNTIGRKNTKLAENYPIASTIIGIGTLAVARRFLPARAALLGGTLLAGYITKKYADYQADQEKGGEAYADVKLAGTEASAADKAAVAGAAVKRAANGAAKKVATAKQPPAR